MLGARWPVRHFFLEAGRDFLLCRPRSTSCWRGSGSGEQLVRHVGARMRADREADTLTVRAENPVHGPDQQSCSPGIQHHGIDQRASTLYRFKTNRAASDLGLVGSATLRPGLHPQDVHPPGPHLHDEQHVQTPEEDRVHVEEITGQQAVRLRAQERPVARSQRAASRRPGPCRRGLRQRQTWTAMSAPAAVMMTSL